MCLLLASVLILSGCSSERDDAAKPELIIFCGVTMIAPMLELANDFKQERNVEVELSFGGSQDLAKSIEVNRLGDVFLPGVRSFVDDMQKKGHVTDISVVGHNELALFVRKGNPLGLTADLGQLADPSLAVVIGHEDLGSVGKETRKLLTMHGLYDGVVGNAAFMAADSKGLMAAVVDGRADIVLNWKAVYRNKDNEDHVDVIDIDGVDGVERKELAMGRLIYSKYPDLAKAFIDFCTSDHGRAVFEKYGF